MRKIAIITGLLVGLISAGVVTASVVLRPVEPISAMDAMQSACGNLDTAKYYDGMSSMTISQDGVDLDETISGKFEVAGPDFSNSVKHLNAGLSWEQVYVDGKGYMRDIITNHEWQEAYYPLEATNEAFPMLGDTPGCPTLTNVTKVGDEVIDGVAVTKYTSGDGKGVLDEALLDEAFRGTKEADLHEFWVDGQGRLRQYYNEHYMVVHYEGSAEGKTTGVYRTLTTFSGHGEPNTITAPAVGE